MEGYLSPRVEEEMDEWLINVGLVFFHVVDDALACTCAQAVWKTSDVPSATLHHKPGFAEVRSMCKLRN